MTAWKGRMTNNSQAYILFDLAGTLYGLRSTDVQHIEMLEKITPVPNAPPFIEGVVFSRGQVMPAVNLRSRFGMPQQPHTLRTRLLIVQSHGRAVGLIVDSAREFRTIPPEVIQPPDTTAAGLSGNFLSGIATSEDRLILLLNLETTLSFAEMAIPVAAGEHALTNG